MERKANRKRRFFLATLLSLCALGVITTTFAAFLIGENTWGTDSPDISVGFVDKQSYTVTATLTGDKTLKLEPKKTDTSGRVQFKTGSDSEKLSLDLDVKILGDTQLYNAVSITATASKKDASKTDDLFTLKYLKFDEIVIVGSESWDCPAEETTIFSTTVSFSWGDAFSNMNPSEYYDIDEQGKLVDDSTMESTLNNLKESANNTKIELKVIPFAKG